MAKKQQQKTPGPIAICVHVFNYVDFSIYFNHVYVAAHWSREFELLFVGRNGLGAAEARNLIVEQALERGCLYALFIDGDHLIPVETLPYLLEAMQASEGAMVSGIVCKKGDRFQQICWEVREVDGKKEYYEVTLPLDGRLYEVSVCAFGCTLIDLKKLKRLKKPYFRDTCDMPSQGSLANVRSDINICNAFRDNGEKIWVDTRILVGHLGVPGIVYPQGAELFDKLKYMERESRKLKEGQEGKYFYSMWGKQ